MEIRHWSFNLFYMCDWLVPKCCPIACYWSLVVRVQMVAQNHQSKGTK